MTVEEARMEILPISSIHIGKRIRKDLGNLSDLADKIERVGLLEPVVVMQCADGSFELIAGLRRIRAVELLHRTDIKAHILTPDEAEKKLYEMEIYENASHKSFTAEEIAECSPILRKILTEKANVRRARYSVENRAKMLERDGRPTQENGRVRDIAAKKLGMRSGRQLARLDAIAEKWPDLLPKIGLKSTDKPLTVTSAYRIATEAEPSESVEPAKPPTAASNDSIRVLIQPVDMGRFKPINPNEIPGDDHTKLMRNKTYAALYTKFQEAAHLATDAITEMRRRCAIYERQIRAYEENKRAMGRDIAMLSEDNDKLRIRLGEHVTKPKTTIITEVPMKIQHNTIPIESITAVPTREDTSFADVIESSLAQDGQITSIVVSDNNDGTYTLIDGYLRLLAMKRLGWTEALASVLPEMSAQQMIDARDSLHNTRLDLSADEVKCVEEAV